MNTDSYLIADLIDSLKDQYVAQSIGLIAVNQRGYHDLLRASGYDFGTTLPQGRRDNTMYRSLPPFWDAIDRCANNPEFNLNYLGGLLTVHTSWVGDRLGQHKYFDKAPTLEFFRHLRNALSHGNRWHFTNNEPRRPATSREFELDASLHGQTVLFEYMLPGDVFDLFDDTAAHLRSL